MPTSTSNMTVDDFAEYAAKHGRCELIRGEVRDMSPTGSRHGIITARLHYHICRHVYENDLGEVLAAETGFRLDDNGKPTVRAPDIAFVAKARAAAMQTSAFAPIAPDLAVETISPNDSASEVNEKTQWWLDQGVQLVWVVDPENDCVTVHHPDRRARCLRVDETLEGDGVLPGFTLELSELFR